MCPREKSDAQRGAFGRKIWSKFHRGSLRARAGYTGELQLRTDDSIIMSRETFSYT